MAARSPLEFTGEIFKLLVGPQKVQINAHESILYRSPVLKAMCTLQFKEGITKVIELPEDEPALFDKFLGCLYGNFKDSFPKSTRTDQELRTLQNLYIMADRYDACGVKDAIVKNFRKWCKDLDEGAAPKILEWVCAVYSEVRSQQPQLRNLLDEYSWKLFTEIKKDEVARIDTLVRGESQLAGDLVRVLVKIVQGKKKEPETPPSTRLRSSTTPRKRLLPRN